MDNGTSELLHRLGVGGFVLLLSLIAVYIAFHFIEVLVVAVFLYYAVRPLHQKLRLLHLSKRTRAILSISLFGLPFIGLTVYAFTVIIHEVQKFLLQYDSLDAMVEDYLFEDETGTINFEEVQALVSEFQENTQLVDGLLTIPDLLSHVSSIFIQLLILLVLTYVMLVDGPRFRDWVVTTVDRNGIVELYAEMADYELSRTLFGNIVNVFITGAIAVAIFSLYNVYAPAAIQIPFPGLLGALAGFGSLIPMVGIKLVYVPLTTWLLFNVWVADSFGLLWPVVALFVVSAVVIDFIPDTFIRAYVSGDATHTGVLIVAYIMGPVVLGFYGLILAPILLVLLITAGYVFVPYVLHGREPDELQSKLSEFNKDAPLYSAANSMTTNVKNEISRRYTAVCDSVSKLFK